MCERGNINNKLPLLRLFYNEHLEDHWLFLYVLLLYVISVNYTNYWHSYRKCQTALPHFYPVPHNELIY